MSRIKKLCGWISSTKIKPLDTHTKSKNPVIHMMPYQRPRYCSRNLKTLESIFWYKVSFLLLRFHTTAYIFNLGCTLIFSHCKLPTELCFSVRLCGHAIIFSPQYWESKMISGAEGWCSKTWLLVALACNVSYIGQIIGCSLSYKSWIILGKSLSNLLWVHDSVMKLNTPAQLHFPYLSHLSKQWIFSHALSTYKPSF